jgi:VWFA-related protein
MYGRAFLSALLLYSILLPVRGQQPQPRPSKQSASKQQNPPRDDDQDVVRITTNLVQVDVVVTKDGKQVTDLKPEDFELFEDGHAQKITHFSYISNVPVPTAKVTSGPPSRDTNAPPVVPAVVRPHEVRRTVVLVVDDLGMSFESMGQTRQQLYKFLDEQLQPNDLVAIVRTGGEIGALQQFTTDRRLLHSAIEHLKWNPCSRTGRDVFAPMTPLSIDIVDLGPCGQSSHWTNLVSTFQSLRFVLQGMRDLAGRKSMVILSDDLPIENQVGTFGSQLQKIAELAIRASVVIYTVDTRGLQYTGLTAEDAFPSTSQTKGPIRIGPSPLPSIESLEQIKKIPAMRSAALRQGREGADLIARQTGGFLIYNSNDLGLPRVMDDQRGYYLIGYRPSDETFNRRFHHITVRVKNRELVVRTREGFYGVPESEARPLELTTGEQMNGALISPFGTSDIAVRLTTFFANDEKAGSILRSYLYLNARDLSFTNEPDGWRQATFDFSSIMFGDNGSLVSRQDQTAKLRLRGKTYDQALREGFVYSFDMPAKQYGVLQFRVAVRDPISGRIGTAGQFIEVPDLRKDRLVLSGIVIQDEANVRARSSLKEQTPVEDEDITNGPAVRRFRQGSTVTCATRCTTPTSTRPPICLY